MTNIKYLKDKNLYEAHKHFMRLSEAYIPLPEDLEEADDEQQPQDPNGGGMPQDPSMGGDSPNGEDPNAMDGDGSLPTDNGMQDPNGGGMPQDPSMGGDSNEGEGDPSMVGGDVQPPMDAPMGDAMPLEPPMEDDGSTIDIQGLTKAQDKLNIKQNHIGQDLSKVDDKILSLIDKIQGLQDALDSNNSEIESLKAEFEKRNPTQTEKLNLRSLDSYPFNVKPTDYWKQKAAEGGYQAYADNDEPTTQEYEITNDDVDNPSQNIADTFFNIDDDDIQTMEKLFKM